MPLDKRTTFLVLIALNFMQQQQAAATAAMAAYQLLVAARRRPRPRPGPRGPRNTKNRPSKLRNWEALVEEEQWYDARFASHFQRLFRTTSPPSTDWPKRSPNVVHCERTRQAAGAVWRGRGRG